MTPARNARLSNATDAQTMRKGDIVLILRPKLPARIARFVRYGRASGKVHVRFRDGKTRRYSSSSVKVALRCAPFAG